MSNALSPDQATTAQGTLPAKTNNAATANLSRLQPGFRWSHDHQLAVVLFLKWTELSMFNAGQLLGLNVATLNRFKTKFNPKELQLCFCPKRHNEAWVNQTVLEVIEIANPGSQVILPFAA